MSLEQAALYLELNSFLSPGMPTYQNPLPSDSKLEIMWKTVAALLKVIQ